MDGEVAMLNEARANEKVGANEGPGDRRTCTAWVGMEIEDTATDNSATEAPQVQQHDLATRLRSRTGITRLSHAPGLVCAARPEGTVDACSHPDDVNPSPIGARKMKPSCAVEVHEIIARRHASPRLRYQDRLHRL